MIIYSTLQERIASRDDPFKTGNVFAILIFIVVLQKYFFESFLNYFLGDPTLFTPALIVTFRQSLTAIEFLFLHIPMKHNFSVQHLEI